MDKKAIQQKRKMRYFIDAAKQVVREEGVGNLTVKKVADLAGYAPGTLYNYFKDLRTLLAYCIADFLEECKEVVIEAGQGYQPSKEKVIRLAQAYCNYFIENPNIYQLVFLEDLGAPPEEARVKGIVPEVVQLLVGSLQECADEGILEQTEVKVIESLLGNSIHGILIFMLKQRKEITREEVMSVIEDQVHFLFKN